DVEGGGRAHLSNLLVRGSTRGIGVIGASHADVTSAFIQARRFGALMKNGGELHLEDARISASDLGLKLEGRSSVALSAVAFDGIADRAMWIDSPEASLTATVVAVRGGGGAVFADKGGSIDLARLSMEEIRSLGIYAVGPRRIRIHDLIARSSKTATAVV